MFAVVESGSITSMPNGNKGIQIGDIKHPASIFTVWTEAERNAIGVYTVEIDETNKKSDEYYLNTAITYSYDSSADKVKGSYGTATAKSLDDVLFTQADEDNGLGTKGQLNYRGLKYIKKLGIEQQCNSMQTQIDNAANVDALAALFTYTTTDGVTSRPLGEFPVKE